MKVSSPDKLLYPDDGITKAAVVAHFERVGDPMLEFVGGRPLTLERFPRGIKAKGFMQKNAFGPLPCLYPSIGGPQARRWDHYLRRCRTGL